MNKMNSAWQAASEDIYKASQEAGAQGDATANAETNQEGKSSEEVTDVEFEEVDDSK